MEELGTRTQEIYLLGERAASACVLPLLPLPLLLRHFSSSRNFKNFVFLAISVDLTLVHFFLLATAPSSGSAPAAKLPPVPVPVATPTPIVHAPTAAAAVRLLCEAVADRQPLLWLPTGQLLLLWLWICC